MIEDVEVFLKAFGQTTNIDNKRQSELYDKLMSEEFVEFGQARLMNNDVEQLDAVCDLIWVTIGFALSRGWDLEGAFKEVARSNMSKLGPDGKPIRREDGKILKPSTWSPPNLGKFVSKT